MIFKPVLPCLIEKENRSKAIVLIYQYILIKMNYININLQKLSLKLVIKKLSYGNSLQKWYNFLKIYFLIL